ncbi:uncharacterized protein LY89DRAFT_756171 [Mollisia scopiformis]|uniref:Uncharacterized protein n=1 Tax=Mollisia scopiformis TaxID=149040 RepID=A0A194WYC2_MOLSC|nr:uncharacterized protein LY89DRAFT_756171 [Mollisia scopiformis]KUJ12935.1 hypothetical protein LY89DRAFT_756171 [Mollisia scopiformis]
MFKVFTLLAAMATGIIANEITDAAADYVGCTVNAYNTADCSGTIVSSTLHDCNVAQPCEAQAGASLELVCFNGCEGQLFVSVDDSCAGNLVVPAGECPEVQDVGQIQSQVVF